MRIHVFFVGAIIDRPFVRYTVTHHGYAPHTIRQAPLSPAVRELSQRASLGMAGSRWVAVGTPTRRGTFATAAGGGKREQKGVAAVAEHKRVSRVRCDAVTATGVGACTSRMVDRGYTGARFCLAERGAAPTTPPHDAAILHAKGGCRKCGSRLWFDPWGGQRSFHRLPSVGIKDRYELPSDHSYSLPIFFSLS